MQAPKGLAGVVVAQSSISDVQSAGVLTYRGRAIADLTDIPFLRVAQLVVTGVDAAEHRVQEDWTELFEQDKRLPAHLQRLVLQLPRDMSPLLVLQTMAPVLAAECPHTDPVRRGFAIAAKLPEVLLTRVAGVPIRLGQRGDYAEQFVIALCQHQQKDKLDDEQRALFARALNVAQVLQIEHSLNAGTFAARVVASTKASVECAIAAGFGALSGALHGGADHDAMAMADRLDDPDHAAAFVAQMLADGTKVPGMGHREYRVRDPRAVCLDEWADKMAGTAQLRDTYAKLQAIEVAFREQMAQRGKQVYTNVDFYKGVVYRALGLPDAAFTAMFALARVFGYIAHFVENAQDNRIYRPQAEYVGS